MEDEMDANALYRQDINAPLPSEESEEEMDFESSEEEIVVAPAITENEKMKQTRDQLKE